MLTLMQDSTAGKAIKWILLSLFVLAMCGMIFMDVGGFFRSAQTSNTVAKIGNRNISLPEFDRTATNYLRGQGMTIQDAHRAGITRALLDGMIGREVMLQAAKSAGVVVSDNTLAQEIARLIRPQTLPGEKPQDTLNRLLKQQGMQESDFTEALRGDLVINIINQTIAGAGSTTPDLLVKALSRGESERRDISYVTLTTDNLGIAPTPSDEELQTFYKSVQDRFVTPEKRTFETLVFDSEKLASTISVTQAEIESAYNSSKDRYTKPERRSIRQCILRDKDAAQALIKSGKLQGSECQAMNAFEKDGLPPQIADAVFAASAGSILPDAIETPFGWHAIELIKIEAPQVQDLASVQAAIKNELLLDKIRQTIDSRVSVLDQKLTEGNSMADLVKDSPDLNLVSVPDLNPDGLSEAKKISPAAQTIIKKLVDNTALRSSLFELLDGETSDIQDLGNGMYAAFAVQTITPETPKDFASVKAQLKDLWVSQNRARQLAEKTLDLQMQVTKSPTALGEIAAKYKTSVKTIRALEPADTNLPFGDDQTVARLFRLTPETQADISANGAQSITLAMVTNVTMDKANKDSKITADNLSGLETQIISDVVRANLQEKIGVTQHLEVLDRQYGAENTNPDQ